MRSAVPVLLLCSAILVACSEPTSPEATGIDPLFANVPTNSVTGGGRVDYTGEVGAPDGYTEVQSISARSRPDGSAEGQVESHWPAPSDVKFHGAVDCLEVEGNTATLGFTVTRSDNPDFPEGSRWVVRVRDGGKQDAISYYFRVNILPVEVTCQTPQLLVQYYGTTNVARWFTLTNGNFKVR